MEYFNLTAVTTSNPATCMTIMMRSKDVGMTDKTAVIVWKPSAIDQGHGNTRRQKLSVSTAPCDQPIDLGLRDVESPGGEGARLLYANAPVTERADWPVEILSVVGVMQEDQLIVVEFEEDTAERVPRPGRNVARSFPADHGGRRCPGGVELDSRNRRGQFRRRSRRATNDDATAQGGPSILQCNELERGNVDNDQLPPAGHIDANPLQGRRQARGRRVRFCRRCGVLPGRGASHGRQHQRQNGYQPA